MKAKVLFAHRARRIFFFIHLWLGLILGAWFALIGITGSVLAWRFELQGMELARRFTIQKPAADATMLPLSQAIAAMKKAHPDASPRELSTITVPNSKMPFYTFSRGRNRATMQTVAVDPYSGKVHSPVRMRTLWVGTVQQFHQRLIAGGKGYIFNGFLTALSIPLLLSGLWLWWPTKLKHLKTHLTIKRGASLKRTLYDLHNVMGIYLYVVLFVTTLTGAMLVQQHIARDGGIANYLAEQEEAQRQQRGENRGGGANREGRERGGENRESRRGREQQGRQQQGRAAGGREQEKPKVTPVGTRLSEDEVLAAARKLRPQLQLTRINLPQEESEAVQLTFARPVGLALNEEAFLNPYTGEEVTAAASTPREGPGANPVARWTRALHFGEFGGVLSKLIYTFTGLMPLGLFFTGFMLWFRKKRAKSRRV